MTIPGVEALVSPQYYFLGKQVSECLPERETAVPVAVFDVESVRRDFPILHQEVNGTPADLAR